MLSFDTRVLDGLRDSRLKPELIFLTVSSALAFYAFLDSSDAWGVRKNCPVEKLEAYLEISGVLSFGRSAG